jgi:hypothetical protein
VRREVVLALLALTLAAVGGCALDKGGLLDVDDGEDAPSGDDSVVVDAASADEASMDAGATGDASTDVFADSGSEVAADGGGDAPTEARPGADAGVDASTDASAREDLDAVAGDAARDGSVDAPIDAVRPSDAPTDTEVPSDASSDAPNDTGPLPLVWDGGMVVDPQFDDGDWVSFCVALVACGEMPGVSSCVALLSQPSSGDALIPTPDMVADVNNVAPDCEQVARALGGGQSCLVTTADSCDGNSLVTCRWGFAMKIDCGDLGLVCSSGNGNAGCGFGDCAPSQEGETYCIGSNYLARCASGRYEPALDCQTFGGMCVGLPGTAQCQGTGGPMCTGGATCSGTSIVQCMDGLLGSLDCSQAYDPTFSCFVDDAGAPVCAASQSCDPSLATDTCSRAMTKVRFCNEGVDDTYDCIGNGYSGCDGGKCFP